VQGLFVCLCLGAKKMLIAWVHYYLECGWLWFMYGMQVAWCYASAYTVAYAPFVIGIAAAVINFILFLKIGYFRIKYVF
jgi:hypothetical protein